MILKRIEIKSSFLTTVLFFAISFSSKAQTEVVDVLITGAKVFLDKEQGFQDLDVGIRGEKIVFVGEESEAQLEASKRIDAKGMVLSPGFIDPHTHLAFDLSREDRKSNVPYLLQGVTTVFTGNDGSGPLPIGAKLKEWNDHGIGTNAGLMVGHNSVREEVLGLKDVQPTESDLAQMRALVAEAMDEGAFGLSTGLFYAPGSYSKTEEVISLAKVAAINGGIYDTHLRDESSYTVGLLRAVQEVLTIGERAEIPVHISHIKALGKDVWGKSGEVIEMIENAQKKGLKVSANQYPYPASRTNLISAVIPRWAEDGGYESLLNRFKDESVQDSLRAGIVENIRRRGGAETLVFSSADDASLNGRSLQDIADGWELDPAGAVVKALKEDEGIRVISYNMTEEDLHAFMKQEWVMTGSDGTPGHPRKYGSFATKIRKYWKQENVIDLPFLLHNQTVLVAQTLGLKDRGSIQEGHYADLILFDPEKVVDHATFEDPSQLASGMNYVWVNGTMVIVRGEYTGELAGKALKL